MQITKIATNIISILRTLKFEIYLFLHVCYSSISTGAPPLDGSCSGFSRNSTSFGHRVGTQRNRAESSEGAKDSFELNTFMKELVLRRPCICIKDPLDLIDFESKKFMCDMIEFQL